jgi:DhnA family fructose-bisphosphate aldolase class Ia
MPQEDGAGEGPTDQDTRLTEGLDKKGSGAQGGHLGRKIHQKNSTEKLWEGLLGFVGALCGEYAAPS